MLYDWHKCFRFFDKKFSEIGVAMHSDVGNKANFTLNHYYK